MTDLTPKRLELLREIVPTVRRILTFYNPENPAAAASAKLAREAARTLGMDFIERHVTTTEQLAQQVHALAATEADAYFFVADAMVLSLDSSRGENQSFADADHDNLCRSRQQRGSCGIRH